LRNNAEILSKDRFGEKVLHLEDGSILKLFRIKRLISSARIVPYARRFSNNAKKLSIMDIPTVDIVDTFKIPVIKRTAVLYKPLEGITLRNYLENRSITFQTAQKLAHFVADLHNKGIYFRSIHFGNIVVMPDQNFGLIDVSDMTIQRKSLSASKRIRNFYHFTRYNIDQELIAPQIRSFIQAYMEASQLSEHKANKTKAKLIDIFNRQKINWITSVVFLTYNIVWKIIMPILRLNHRLAQGFDQRSLKQNTLQPADIWIQAASAGESYLAWELLKYFKPTPPVKIFITSNTKQGMEILTRAVDQTVSSENNMDATTAYFPFDSPELMRKAIKTVMPKIIVLLESEIWPGFLFEAKKFGCKICILNGRITPKSLKRYHIWPSLWQSLKPDKILAISKDDARRFKKLFKLDQVEVMSNIKFDRIDLSESDHQTINELPKVVQPDTPLVVLGSVRKEEEKDIERIIRKLIKEQPQVVIGLFPRHLNRIKYWTKILNKYKAPWILRSQITKPVSQGTIILWDTFGELHSAYMLSTAVFVGGSLAPLGGQNFLEPLTCGVSPVIGPFWNNFSWVGSEIMAQNLVRIANNWEEVADILISDIANPPLREDITQKALKYLTEHQGGTVQAINLINNLLN